MVLASKLTQVSISAYLLQLSVTSGLVVTLLSTTPLTVSRFAKHPSPSAKDIHEQTQLHGFTLSQYLRLSRGRIIIIIYCTYKATTVVSSSHTATAAVTALTHWWWVR